MRIVYLSWPAREISGGIKAAFGHVEILRAAGMAATIASEDGQAPAWFETSAPVITLGEIRADDALVFPENSAALLERFSAAPHRKLVFCQNPYYAFQGLAGRASYADLGVQGVLCPSHTVMQYCTRRFPGLPLAYTPFFIDHERFACPPQKTLQIACVPRKRQLEVAFIHDLFRAAYPQYAHLEWQLLQDATEQQVAQVLARSAVFLSLARLEAHGMTALEAMASGCLVAGFAGAAGGTDSATAGNGLWAAEDDLTGCTERLAQAVALASQQGPAYQGMVAQGRLTAAAYRREDAARHLLAFWRGWLAA